MNSDKKQNRHSTVLKVACVNLLLGIVMSLSACSNKDDLSKGQSERNQSEATAIENSNEDKAIELYVNVLRNYISAGKTDFSVSFIDLDDDGPREMVVFFGESHTDGGYLFTIKDGEAIQVVAGDNSFFGQYGGGFTYKEKGNVFAAEYESVAVTQISHRISYYAMENGKAVCKDAIQSITQFDSDESEFYVNDMEVDSEKFYSIEENYGLLEMTTVSYSDGVRVMNEQMDMVYKAYNNTEKSADNHFDDDSATANTARPGEQKASAMEKYKSPFTMGDNLKAAIIQLALTYDHFDKDSVDSQDWKETFVTKFIQNSRLSFDYLETISEQNNGQISGDELNYIQYSLTGIEVDFSSYAGGSVDRYDGASPLNYGSISGYDYENTDNGVIVTADFEVGFDGTDSTQKRKITAELVKNPQSCFDGYSVASVSSEVMDSNVGQEENPAGEYEYSSDYGAGKLIIQKTSDGYDISDYESEDSYRFLADSSNIETIENNRIYIKYPEQVFSDGTADFCYYILEYSADGINVYYRKSPQGEEQFLYHATKKSDN